MGANTRHHDQRRNDRGGRETASPRKARDGHEPRRAARTPPAAPASLARAASNEGARPASTRFSAWKRSRRSDPDAGRSSALLQDHPQPGLAPLVMRSCRAHRYLHHDCRIRDRQVLVEHQVQHLALPLRAVAPAPRATRARIRRPPAHVPRARPPARRAFAVFQPDACACSRVRRDGCSSSATNRITPKSQVRNDERWPYTARPEMTRTYAVCSTSSARAGVATRAAQRPAEALVVQPLEPRLQLLGAHLLKLSTGAGDGRPWSLEHE